MHFSFNKFLILLTSLVLSAFVSGCEGDPDPKIDAIVSLFNPQGATLARNEAAVPMLAIDLIASGDHQIKRMMFRKIGHGPTSDIESVWLISTDRQIDIPCRYDRSDGVADCNNLADVLEDGTARTLFILAFFNNATPDAEHGWELNAASDVVLEEPAEVLGPFPMRGDLFTISDQP